MASNGCSADSSAHPIGTVTAAEQGHSAQERDRGCHLVNGASRRLVVHYTPQMVKGPHYKPRKPPMGWGMACRPCVHHCTWPAGQLVPVHHGPAGRLVPVHHGPAGLVYTLCNRGLGTVGLMANLDPTPWCTASPAPTTFSTGVPHPVVLSPHVSKER